MAERYRAAVLPFHSGDQVNCWKYVGWNIQRQRKEQRVAMLARHIQ
jgi:hypothetical protein